VDGLVVDAEGGGDAAAEPVDADVGEKLVLAEHALHVAVAVAPRAELFNDPRQQPWARQACFLRVFIQTCFITVFVQTCFIGGIFLSGMIF
jgi:hypothetical protein